MCRPTDHDQSGLVLERLQQRLQQQLNMNDMAPPRGGGPRVFCGHVPPECSEELVKAHFSQWGHVTDVYFPKRKDTFRRRPFCFVTFNSLGDAQRAIAESPMNICGIPIKQLNLVEDRSDYYKQRHQAAESALVQALQTLALLGNEGGAAGPSAPLSGQVSAMDLNNLAALLSMDNAAGSQLAAASRPQAYPMHQAMPMNGGGGGVPYSNASGYNTGSLPFANLPGYNQASARLAMPTAAPAYGQAARYAAPAQPAFPPASSAALAAAFAGPSGSSCRLSGGSDCAMPNGAGSPFGPLDTQNPSASSSPPRSELCMQIPLQMQRSSGSDSNGSVSPPLDAASANRWPCGSCRLSCWQAGAAPAIGLPPHR